VPFLVSHDPAERPVGWLLPEVAAAIGRDHLRHFQRDSASPWEVKYFEEGVAGPGRERSKTPLVGTPEMIQSVAFADWVNEGGSHARTLHVERLVLEWRRKKVFAELLKGEFEGIWVMESAHGRIDWSDEPYPVFNHPTPAHVADEPIAFAIERAALPIFGLPNYGSLLTAYVHDPDAKVTKLWIPTRSKTKKKWVHIRWCCTPY